MPVGIRKVNVIGHLHPDTDSICSAIAYAHLKNEVEKTDIYQPRRAGAINRETAFVLRQFGFAEPELITSVTPQIKDTEIQRQGGIDGEMSLFAAWNLMRDTKVDTLCVTDEESNLEGLIAVKDIANANMDVFDMSVIGESHTCYANIIDTLNGEMILGNPTDRVTRGNVCVGTTPEMMEDTVKPGDIVLVTNRYETQQFAVECEASCLVVCCSAHVSSKVIASAERHGCAIIATPYDTYAAARIISMSIPVRAKMLSEGLLKVSVNTSVDDARKMMAHSRHRFFPVIDENSKYVGLISSPNLLAAKKKHVILVDHNERSQSVEGLEQAEIMEIIDHHRIGSIETYFRNMPVGCTCTIVYMMYRENNVEIPKDVAGLMLSAILSDTLAFRSPTCTQVDRDTAKALAKIAEVDIDTYADEMFEAGADLTGRQLHDREEPQGGRGARGTLPARGRRARGAPARLLPVHRRQELVERGAVVRRGRRGHHRARLRHRPQGRHGAPARRGEPQEAGHSRPHGNAPEHPGGRRLASGLPDVIGTRPSDSRPAGGISCLRHVGRAK